MMQVSQQAFLYFKSSLYLSAHLQKTDVHLSTLLTTLSKHITIQVLPLGVVVYTIHFAFPPVFEQDWRSTKLLLIITFNTLQQRKYFTSVLFSLQVTSLQTCKTDHLLSLVVNFRWVCSKRCGKTIYYLHPWKLQQLQRAQ